MLPWHRPAVAEVVAQDPVRAIRAVKARAAAAVVAPVVVALAQVTPTAPGLAIPTAWVAVARAEAAAPVQETRAALDPATNLAEVGTSTVMGPGTSARPRERLAHCER